MIDTSSHPPAGRSLSYHFLQAIRCEELACLREQLTVGYVVLIDHDRSFNLLGDISVIVFQIGDQLLHRTALAGSVPKYQDSIGAAQRCGDGFIEALPLRLPLTVGFFAFGMQVPTEAVRVVRNELMGDGPVQLSTVDLGLVVVDDDEQVCVLAAGRRNSWFGRFFQKVANGQYVLDRGDILMLGGVQRHRLSVASDLDPALWALGHLSQRLE